MAIEVTIEQKKLVVPNLIVLKKLEALLDKCEVLDNTYSVGSKDNQITPDCTGVKVIGNMRFISDKEYQEMYTVNETEIPKLINTENKEEHF